MHCYGVWTLSNYLYLLPLKCNCKRDESTVSAYFSQVKSLIFMKVQESHKMSQIPYRAICAQSCYLQGMLLYAVQTIILSQMDVGFDVYL